MHMISFDNVQSITLWCTNYLPSTEGAPADVTDDVIKGCCTAIHHRAIGIAWRSRRQRD